MEFNNIFITVGTTKFDQLIKCICTRNVINLFKEKFHCKKLVLQIGNGHDYSSDFLSEQFNDISIEVYTLKSSVLFDINNADFIISHAGAGSCIEILNAGKKLLVVVNEELMDNHQIELAEQLAKDEYLYYCTPGTLFSTLQNSDFTALKPYKPGNVKQFIKYLDKIMDYENSN